MPRLPPRTNYVKLVDQAKRSKKNVSQSEVAAYEKWRKKFSKKAPKLDKLEDMLRKGLDEIEEARKAKVEDAKMHARFAKMVAEAMKELSVYKEVKVSEKLPPAPKNATAVSAFSVVFLAMIIYLAAVKAKLAMAEAATEKAK
jgi:flagellar biosynthesis/type III secretory pathway protein FliH